MFGYSMLGSYIVFCELGLFDLFSYSQVQLEVFYYQVQVLGQDFEGIGKLCMWVVYFFVYDVFFCFIVEFFLIYIYDFKRVGIYFDNYGFFF